MTGNGGKRTDLLKTLPDPGRTMPDMRAIVPRSSRPPRPEELKAVLVVLAGSQLGERVVIDQPVAIGRAPDNQFVLRDPAVSWKHCLVEQVRGQENDTRIRVRDLGSKHGIEVNGERVSGDRFLASGDQLGVGDTLMRLEHHDPVEQAFDNAVIERIAKDDLTGLLSRRRFEADLAALVEAATLGGETLALVMLDIDGIKAINDQYGHLAGAQVIGDVGRLLGRIVGARGLCARLSGDEFATTLPRATPASALVLVEQVLREVRALPIHFAGMTLSVTISAGMAFLPEDGADEATLMRVADERLLAAKQGGRDRIA